MNADKNRISITQDDRLESVGYTKNSINDLVSQLTLQGVETPIVKNVKHSEEQQISPASLRIDLTTTNKII